MRNSFRAIGEFMDSVDTKRSRSLRGLLKMHNEEKSFRNVFDRHIHSRKIEKNFMFLNTYLMDVDAKATGTVGGGLLGSILDAFVVGITGGIVPPGATTAGGFIGGGVAGEVIEDKAKKPAVSERATELGRYINFHKMDISILCEVFEKNVRKKIVRDEFNQMYIVSQIAESTTDSSGLVNFVNKLDIKSKPKKYFHEFKAEEGSDVFAAKGILMTVLDFGLGESSLEVYSTHLNAGGGGTTRIAQLEELVRFFNKVHNPINPVIFSGDFNIGVYEDNDYSELNQKLNSLNLIDLWEARNKIDGKTTPGYTSGIRRIPHLIGKTDEDERFYKDEVSPNQPNEVKVNGELQANRIDYIWVSKPSPYHSFYLDFTRPRRLNMERNAPHNPNYPNSNQIPKYDEIKFLSDHIGLFTNLMMTPNPNFNP